MIYSKTISVTKMTWHMHFGNGNNGKRLGEERMHQKTLQGAVPLYSDGWVGAEQGTLRLTTTGSEKKTRQIPN